METISIVVMEGEQAVRVSVDVVEAHITLASLLAAVPCSPRHRRTVAGSAVQVGGKSCISLEAAQLWLEKHARRDIANNLIPAVRAQSVSVRVAEVEHAQEVAARAAEVVHVGHDLDGVDEFRKACAEQPAHLRPLPDLINGAAKRGYLETFEIYRDMWDDNAPAIYTRSEIQLLDKGQRLPSFNVEGFKRSHAEGRFLTGPEMQAQHPDHPLLKRRHIPSYEFVVATDDAGNGRVVTVPEHDEVFTWEEDLGKKPKGLP